MAEWSWPGTLIFRVIDGDTVDAHVTRDLGFDGWVTLLMRLRLNRIDAYPIKTQKGKDGAALVHTLTYGVPLLVHTIKKYKFAGPENTPIAEYMAEVTLRDGRNLSDVMVGEGLAVYWNGEGPRPAV